MNQEITQAPTEEPFKNKNNINWINIIAIIFLFCIPPLGIILMWILTKWSKKIKIIITTIFILLIIIPFLGIFLNLSLSSLNYSKEKEKDVIVQTGMKQIQAIAEIIYKEEGSYVNVNCDHPKLSPLCNEINKTARFFSRDIKFFSSTTAYCAYADEPVSGYSICINNKFFRGGIPIPVEFCKEGIFFCTLSEFSQTSKGQSCINSGGEIDLNFCCSEFENFSNLCQNPCVLKFVEGGCSINNFYENINCDCGDNKCFNGAECISK